MMSNVDQNVDRKVIILPNETFENEGERLDLEVVTLRHPFTCQGCKFLLPRSGERLYEINVQKEKWASWFIGETVKEDGSLHVTTKFDPLYLVLPYLIEAFSCGKYMLLDQILKDEEYPDCEKLYKLCSHDDIMNVADLKGSGSYAAFKYDQDKTISWLSAKINILKNALKSSGLFIPASDEDDKENEDVHLEYAFGILSNYLPRGVSSLLQSHLNIQKKPDKRKICDTGNQPQAKKTKTEKGHVDTGKPKKQLKMSKAQRELSKVDKKGMKSISSFFTKKTK